MRTLRWFLCLCLAAAGAPWAHAQFLGPFADPGMLYPPCAGMMDGMANGFMMDPMAMNSMCLMPMIYQSPLQSFYSNGYSYGQQGLRKPPKSGKIHPAYTSYGQARLAYAQEGLRALDGIHLANGLSVGHGGRIVLPDGEAVRPRVDRATGRLAIPAGRIAASNARVAEARSGALGASESGRGSNGAEHGGGAMRGGGMAGGAHGGGGMSGGGASSGGGHH
jgi:hypothetical protein